MTPQPQTSQFLLLLRQPHEGPAPTPEEMQHIMSRFGEWMDQMRRNGAVVGTNGLENTGTVLRGSRGLSTTDGPFAESKEIVGGYVLVQAGSLSEAIEMARDCPGLDYRMTVEVRPVRNPHEG